MSSSSLRYRQLGSTGLSVSEVGFGALEIGRDWAADVNPDPSHCSFEEAAHVLNGLLDAGVNFIDTAPAYWNSEDFIGRAIPHRRSEYVLATKVGEHCDKSGSFYDYSHAATLAFIDRSLQRLKTDVIDLLQIHSAKMDVLERGETFAAMDEARRAGKVRHIGMTGGVAEAIRAVEIGGYETVQVPYNLLNPAAEDHLLPLAAQRGVGVIIMRPLAGGKLSGKYANLENADLRQAIQSFMQFVGNDAGQPKDLVQLALGYVLARPEISTIIPGSRRLEVMLDNIRQVATALSPALVAKVAAHTRTITASAW